MTRMNRVGPLLLAALLVAGLSVGGAGPVWAESNAGVAIVYATDLAKGTVTFETGQVVRVTPETLIVDASGAPMKLADVPVAKEVMPGIRAIVPGSTFRFETTPAAGGDPVLVRLEQASETLE